MRIRILTFFFIVISGYGFSQQKGSISGTVSNLNQEFLFGATVYLGETQLGTQTNGKGVYSIKNIPYGTYWLTVSYIGYHSISQQIILSSEQQHIKVNFKLEENTEQLREVTVNGKSKKTALETEGFAVTAIQTEEASIRNIQTNELLNTTVGVKIRQNGGLGSNVEYSLNGLSGSAVRIFIDGIPISMYGSSFSLNSIPPSMIKEIQVYKGVVPGHLADDALGGAINIELHNEAKNGINASISYGSFNTVQSNANGVYRFKETGFTVKAAVFQNYSDNDYKVSGRSIVTTGLGGVQTPIEARRFNDAYRSIGGMVQVGFTTVSWADQFLIGLTGSDDYKEVQHGAFTTITPYKGRFLESDALLANLIYQKKNLFTEGLDITINGLYGKRNRMVNDTTAVAYSWTGERAIDFRGNEFEYIWGSQQEGGPTLAKIERNVASIRSGISYSFNENHQLLFNHVFSSIDRVDSDELNTAFENTFVGTRDLRKHILSLTYDISAFDNRLQSSIFGKHYQQNNISVDPAYGTDQDGNTIIVDETVESNTTNEGYGFAASYALWPEFTLLTSAEKAIRLPNETEIFGNDGDNVIANSSINPEKSNNYNLGFRLGTLTLGKHDFVLATNFFTRNIKDRIGLPLETSLNIDDELIVYVNQGSGTSTGFDAQFTYSYNKNLAFDFNISKFDLKVESNGINVPVPNTPFLTMNASLRYQLKRDFLAKSRVNLFYNLYYTDEFSYLVPQGSNTAGTDFFTVPQQLAQDIGLSFQFPNKNVVMSFDVKNIFDAAVYDNLSVQKPGRAFYLKLNYTINNL